MKMLLILSLCFFSVTLLTGQDNEHGKYINSITADELSSHVHSLASPAFEGRYTGSEGIRMAAEYIQKDFAEMGLKSPAGHTGQPYFQSFVLEKCYWQDQQLSVDGLFLDPIHDYYFLSDPQHIEREYEVVFSGFGLNDVAYSDYKDLDVEGKLVLAFSGEPRDSDGIYFISGREKPSRQAYYYSKIKLARDKGAAGLLIIAQKDRDYRRYTKGVTDYRSRADIRDPGQGKEKHDNFFTLFIHQDAAAELLGIRPGKLKKVRKKTEKERISFAGSYKSKLKVSTIKECYPMNTENVLGYIEGTDMKNEAVVVVAHYDHLGKRGEDIYYGADDNASGTAAVMEVAEAFALAEKDGLSSLRTVIFLAVSAEEIGLHGSRYYSGNPMIALDKTYACVNIDMIGRVGSNYEDKPDYVGGMAYVSKDILEVARGGAESAAPELAFRVSYRERLSGGSDHYYFAKNGIPSLFYFTGIHEDYHQPSDTPDKILYQRMEGITRSIFATVWELANREEELSVDN